ncbi:MAG: hypothetical protein ACLU8W_02725 [Clostridia bacterium]
MGTWCVQRLGVGLHGLGDPWGIQPVVQAEGECDAMLGPSTAPA